MESVGGVSHKVVVSGRPFAGRSSVFVRSVLKIIVFADAVQVAEAIPEAEEAEVETD